VDGPAQFVATCRVCGADDWLDVLSFGRVPLANGFLPPSEHYDDEPTYPLDVGLCRDCGLLSLRHLVDPRLLFEHYVYATSSSRSMVEHMRRVVDLCRRRAGLPERGLVVEFGSNIGSQLAMFQSRGFRTVGVDPARNLVDVANEHGVETLAAYFAPESAAVVVAEHGVADLVLGRQTLAHIPDLHGLLDAVDVTLGPEGVLAIEVPHMLDLLEQNQFDTIYHEHASYFSLATLCHLLARHGLRVFDVERVLVHGGSIVVLAARNGSSWRTQPSVAGLLDLERRRGLRTDRAYVEFARRSRRVAGRIAAIVRDLAGQGQRVAGYGAPSKGSALLLACGLDATDLEFCSDTTTLKHGTVLPGSHVPVCSPEEARDRDPDVYLLLAWNYAEEIIAHERDFIAAGGRFVIPVPEPRMVGAGARRGAAPAVAVR
jgi:hypothetical protein